MFRRNPKDLHANFLFSIAPSYPPNVHDVKAYYVSREMLRRGIRVTWTSFGKRFRVSSRDRIEFVTLPGFGVGFHRLGWLIEILGMLLYCKISGTQCVYVDEWLFSREEPRKLLWFEAALKFAGVMFVLDSRDPYVDFEISIHHISVGSLQHARLSRLYTHIYRLADLIILPSKQYEKAMISDRIPANKLFGTFRGVDPQLFRPIEDAQGAKEKLGLGDKFVIGWFGIMHSYRQISDVLIPLIKSIQNLIPNAFVVIGGDGPEMKEFVKLRETLPAAPFAILGFIPYEKLADYIAGCDVLLAPVDTRFRFSRSSIWLKIFEALAIGRPVISTRTPLSEGELSHLKGVLWVNGDVSSFLNALSEVNSNYSNYYSVSMSQARAFSEYKTTYTIPTIVDGISNAIGWRTSSYDKE